MAKISFIATALGFFAGGLVEKGQAFSAEEDQKFSWAKPAVDFDLVDGEAQIEDNPIKILLAKTAKEILDAVKDDNAAFTAADLRAIIDAETGGSKRKSVLAFLADAEANLKQKELDDLAAGASQGSGADLING